MCINLLFFDYKNKNSKLRDSITKRHSQKLRNFFSKRKENRPKRSSGKKRKFTASGALATGLLFGRLKTNFDKIQNYQSATAEKFILFFKVKFIL
jgi:hypothetical protein